MIPLKPSPSLKHLFLKSKYKNNANNTFLLIITSLNIFHFERKVVVIINIIAVHKHLRTTNSTCPIKETYSKYKTPIKPHQKEPREVKIKPLLKFSFMNNLMN